MYHYQYQSSASHSHDGHTSNKWMCWSSPFGFIKHRISILTTNKTTINLVDSKQFFMFCVNKNGFVGLGSLQYVFVCICVSVHWAHCIHRNYLSTLFPSSPPPLRPFIEIPIWVNLSHFTPTRSLHSLPFLVSRQYTSTSHQIRFWCGRRKPITLRTRCT